MQKCIAANVSPAGASGVGTIDDNVPIGMWLLEGREGDGIRTGVRLAAKWCCAIKIDRHTQIPWGLRHGMLGKTQARWARCDTLDPPAWLQSQCP